MVLGKVYRLSHRIVQDSVYSLILEHRNDKSEALLFEAETISVISSQEVESKRPQYSTVTDVYGCLGVLQVATGDSSYLQFLVLISGCVSIGKILHSEIFRITDTIFLSLRNNPTDYDKIQETRRILNSGSFYFSWSTNATQMPMDLTKCAQKTLRDLNSIDTNSNHSSNLNETDYDVDVDGSQFSYDQVKQQTFKSENRFFWNRTLFIQFLRFGINTNRWLHKIVCGSISISTVYVGHHQAKAVIFSRLSSERVGTRFNVRGVNDDGYVANFVETEQVIYIDRKVSSFIIIRGSVPLFWEQPGINVGSHKIKMSRGSELSQQAYDRHLLLLKRRYGQQTYINLMGSKEGESMLTKLYKAHHKASNFSSDVKMINFDYHSECPRGKQDHLHKYLKHDIHKLLDEYCYFYSNDYKLVSEQLGTFRVNCVDCLDRTNCVQTFIGLEVLQKQLQSLGLAEKSQVVSRFDEVFRNLWITNGDQISRIYAGTGALEGKSKLKDSTLSVARTIQNNLLDSSKQEAMDILLHSRLVSNEYTERARSVLSTKYLHLPQNVLIDLCDRYLEYTEPISVRVAVGTWNVNGGKHFNSIIYKRTNPLSDWLLDYKNPAKQVQHLQSSSSPSLNILDISHDTLTNTLMNNDQNSNNDLIDIYAIGFEEIVDLNASNIVAASTTNQKEWLTELQKTISRDTPYILVTSVQLVGVCLFVFVRPKLAPFIRDIAVDQVKTGLGGATGNKGGVAIRMLLFNSSICFVCAHFAAGQSQVADRNADYSEITRKINFPLGRSLNSHDFIFWCGDFNYRIDMDNEKVKELVKMRDWTTLLAADQLKVQQADGKVFRSYIEAEIKFPPTYKYDINSDDYDTSEKCRVPAYTDRVLVKKRTPRKLTLGDNQNKDTDPDVQIVHYTRAELKTSDHRPVIGEFLVNARKVINEKRDKVFTQVLQETGPPDATVLIRHLDGVDYFNDELVAKVLKCLADSGGEVILARFTYDYFSVTFRESKSAINAVNYNGLSMLDPKLTIELKTPNWINIIENELSLFTDNAISLQSSSDYNTIDQLSISEFNLSLGPTCDPNYLCIDDNEDRLHSGRNSPCNEGDSPPPLPGRSTPTHVAKNKVNLPPSRPPPPPGNEVKRVPVRPAPPPPSVFNNVSNFESLQQTPLPPPPPAVGSASPPEIPPPTLPNNGEDFFEIEGDFEEYPCPPVPPPRVDSFEKEEEPPLSPWQMLPPAPPLPPVEKPEIPPPIPERPKVMPHLDLESNSPPEVLTEPPTRPPPIPARIKPQLSNCPPLPVIPPRRNN